jgi:hypothetical protein
VVHEGQPFAGSPITNSAFSPAPTARYGRTLGLPGFQIKELVFKQPGFFRHKWRVRVEYPLHKMIDGQRYSRWFYGYASAVGDIGVLPVELVTFEGKPEVTDGNLLTWSTASESNSAYFLVERGIDPPALRGGGKCPCSWSKQPTRPRIPSLMMTAPKGLSYYRLAIVDSRSG